MAQEMGIGQLGEPTRIIKRKFRYTCSFNTKPGVIPEHYVKVAARPQLEIDELELQFLNASTWIPGKARWQPLNITYIDTTDRRMKPLYDWVATVYDFQRYGDGGNLRQSEKEGWVGDCVIRVFDGCGNELEKWELANCFPQSINFGDLDYGSNDECNIELTIRYDKVKITSECGPVPTGMCRGCE